MSLRALALILGLAALPAVAHASKVTVTTDPPGATVQLDGTAVGISPVVIPRVDRGTHLLKVALAGYVTREDTIDVDGDSDLQVHAPLNPAPKIVETPRPPPARVEPTPPPKPASAPLPQVKEAPKEQLPLPVSQLPVAWGTQKKSLVLVVETVPDNAYVQVVGMNEVRRAPATFTGFSAGNIQLVVRAPGYKEKKVEVYLKEDARTRVVLEAGQ